MIRAFLDNIRLAMGTFFAHPLRTLLTLLGIVIGVATVMVMMALLEGLRVKVNKDLGQLGANVFRVDKWPQGLHFGGSGARLTLYLLVGAGIWRQKQDSEQHKYVR